MPGKSQLAPSPSQSFHFTTIELPGGYPYVSAINNDGEVTGVYDANIGPPEYGLVRNGFIYNSGTLTILDAPSRDYWINTVGINNSGEVAGYYFDPSYLQYPQGFVYQNGTFAPINPPNSIQSIVTGINNAGDVTGFYTEPTGEQQHAFIYQNGGYTIFDAPSGGFWLTPSAINDQEEVTGTAGYHGFIYDKGNLHHF